MVTWGSTILRNIHKYHGLTLKNSGVCRWLNNLKYPFIASNAVVD